MKKKKFFKSKKGTGLREQVIQHRRDEGIPQDDGKRRLQDDCNTAGSTKQPGKTPAEKSSRREYY